MAAGLPSSLASRPTLGSRRVQLALLAAAVFLSVATLTRLPGWPLVDARAFDYLSTLWHEPLPDEGPVIVAIDEPSFADLKAQWPWPRSVHARLVTALRAAGARVIALDIIFSEPTTAAEDAALAEALGPDVVLAGDETLISSSQADQFVRTLPLGLFTDTGAKAGIASIALGGDGVVRELPSLDDSFAALIAETAGLPTRLPESGTLMQAFGGARTYPTVSYYQALDPENLLPPDTFRDRVVIVGLSLQNTPTVTGGGADAFATPYTVHTGRLVAGAEIHATIFDNLKTESGIVTASPRLALALLLLSSLGAVALVWRGTGWMAVIGVVAAVLGFSVASYLALRFGRVFASPIAPSLAFVAIAAGQATLDYAAERRSRRQITQAFGQYLSPDLVARLAEDPGQLKLGGEKRTLSVLFCDVRGFTTIAEGLKDDPEELTHLINRLLTPLSDVVLAHGGTIDKYIGDCIMAFWNAPLENEAHPHEAVAAGLDMLAAIDRLNLELEAEARAEDKVFMPLRIGIGINTGECVVGNMGSTRRFDYSALGDAVNLASRLEGASKQFGVPLLLGEVTAALVADRFPVLELDRITVKGRSIGTAVATVLPGTDHAALALHRRFIAARYAGNVPECRQLADNLAEAIPALAGYYRQGSGN
ncbi:MAG: adenylate/guanylate cyclase domain-containing protein [Rhizobium sp.]|nr:adenylate/guanylate cyclase domain-containing protein [Rhizobium sp.]